MYRWTALIAALLGCSPCAPESPQTAAPQPAASPRGVVDEEWFVVSFEGKTAGSLQQTTTALDGGGYAVELVQKLRIKRVNTPLDMHISLRTTEDAEGRFTGFSFEQDLATQKIHTQGEVTGGELIITERGADEKKRTSSIAAPPQASGYQFAEQQMRALFTHKDPAPGTTLETLLYLPELHRFGKETMTIRKQEQVTVRGSLRKLWRTEVRQEALAGFVITRWVDNDGRLQKFSVPLLGMEVVYERSSREAVESLTVGAPPEIFVSSSIPVANPVRRNCDEAVYRLRFKHKESAGDRTHLVAFTGQEERSSQDGELVLRVRRVAPPAPLRLPVPRPPGDDGATLRANTYIQSDDDELRKAALQAIGDERDAWEAARKLERWVHERVNEKNLETAFATAKEVLTTGEGDCTEHSVLLAALARSVNLPARVVSGLLYSGGAFVGHMWTEVYVGAWIPLDATLGRGTVGADHIALSSSSLEGVALGDMFIQLVRVLGNLDIEVLSSR